MVTHNHLAQSYCQALGPVYSPILCLFPQYLRMVMDWRNGILPTTITFMVKLRSLSHCPRIQYVASASVVSFPPNHLIHQPGHYCWLQHQHCSTDWSHTYFNIFISHNPCVDLDRYQHQTWRMLGEKRIICQMVIFVQLTYHHYHHHLFLSHIS